MADFPSIKPTNRQFTLGQFPIKTYQSLSGKTVKRFFGDKPFGHTIDLSFENVKEDVVNQIINHYDGQNGSAEGFAISEEILVALNTSMQNRLRNPAETLWFYAEPPTIESVYRNVSTVTVRLVAEIV